MGVETPFGIGAHEVLYRDEHGRPWLVSATFGNVGGRNEVIGMKVDGFALTADDLRRMGHPTPEGTAELYARYLPPRGSDDVPALDSTVWRATGGLIRTIRARWVDALVSSGLAARPENSERMRAWQTPRERQQGQLEQVAEVYRAELQAARNEGRRARPRQAVAERLYVGPDAAAQAIARARRAGLLPATSRGRTSEPREVESAQQDTE